jgi:hypothetical protein
VPLPSVAMLSVTSLMLNIIHADCMLNVIMLNVDMLSAIILNVDMLNFIMQSVIVPSGKL